MKRRKFLLGASSVFASGTFVMGSGAFSSTEVQRDFNVSVVGDKNAYLALMTDEEGDATVGLLGADGPFEVLKTIAVGNHLSVDLTMTIESPDPISLGKSKFELPAGQERAVEFNLTKNEPLKAVLDIRANGDGVTIEASREITLKPKEAEIGLSDINAPLQIRNIGDVDPATVRVYANGNEFATTTAGNPNNLKVDYDDATALGCGNPSGQIALTVKGWTTDGVPFFGSVSGMNCAGSDNGKKNGKNNGNKNDQN